MPDNKQKVTKDDNCEIVPDFRIETRISYVARKQGVEVPLGYYSDGRWVPYEFVEGDGGSLVLTPEELAAWLEGANSFEDSFIECPEEAMIAVQETVRRCQALAEAAQQDGANGISE